MNEKPYVIDRVSGQKNLKGEIQEAPEGLWYCHHRDYPWIPVFGSFGTRSHAAAICRQYNGLPKIEKEIEQHESI